MEMFSMHDCYKNYRARSEYIQFRLETCKMQSSLIIVLTVLSLANAAPSDPDSYAPTEAVPLAESDKDHLCKLLNSFNGDRMLLFGAIMSINMEFISKAQESFPNEFAEFMNSNRKRNETLSIWQRKFGVDMDQVKLIIQNETVAQEWAKDHVFESHYLDMNVSLFNVLNSAKEHLVKKVNQLKSILSDATVAKEHEIFESVNQFQNSTKSGQDPILDFMSNLESKIKNKYQCST